jgi:hypothetical protein
MIEAHELTKRYGDTTAVDTISSGVTAPPCGRSAPCSTQAM